VLAGRTPFEVPGGPNAPVDLMSRIERGQVTALRRDDVPRTLAAVLTRGMSTNRDDRYSSALEFGRALQRIELELGFAPTTLEIADAAQHENVVVAAPDDDETRVRSLPTVVPDGPAPPVGAPASTEVSKGHSRVRLVAALAAVLSVLVLAVVALAIVLGGAVERPETNPTPASSGGSAINQDAVPVATDGVAAPSPDGTAVTFTWVNPDPREGDLYYWARAETPSSREALREPEVTVDGIVPGSRVCINVEIGRSGRTSEPLVICTVD
jgi:hypothetical protein